jgi:hypothetical protein
VQRREVAALFLRAVRRLILATAGALPERVNPPAATPGFELSLRYD